MSDKELKLIVAGQCMAGILTNSSAWNSNATNERLAKFAWNCATELMALSKKEEEEKKRKPRECMALTVIAQRNGKDVVALLPSDDFELGMTVRCVEILEDEE